MLEKLLEKKLSFSHGVENNDFNQFFVCLMLCILYCIKDEIV